MGEQRPEMPGDGRRGPAAHLVATLATVGACYLDTPPADALL